MKKKIIIALVVILILGIIIACILKKDNTKEDINLNKNEEINIIENEKNKEENECAERVTLTAEESYLYDSEDWISEDNSNLSTYFKNIDYSKIARKDDSKDLIYEKNYNYIFHGGDWESIIPVINIDSIDADKINKTIENTMSDCYGVEYKFKINNEALALIIKEDREENTTYTVYNINIYTGIID